MAGTSEWLGGKPVAFFATIERDIMGYGIQARVIPHLWWKSLRTVWPHWLVPGCSLGLES